jgi:hypothetical protein
MPRNLSPISVTSAVVLPSAGTHSEVLSSLSLGIYSSNAFVSGAVDQVSYVYNKLAGNVMDIEMPATNVYNAYEDACLEYSYLLNTHQAKNVLSDMLGASTGTFDQDGEMITGPENVNLKFPRFTLDLYNHIAKGPSAQAGMGGNFTIYSASFDSVDSQQDYDLQDIIYSASLSAGSGFYNKIGDSKVHIQNVFYKTPKAIWRFFGGGSATAPGTLTNYGMFSNDTVFSMTPVWQNKAQAMAFEDALGTRTSHFSYELRNNFLRIFPTPSSTSPKKFWVSFRAGENTWDEDDSRQWGSKGINNINTLPFPNVPYENINSIGKQWVRRFALALSKDILGQVRSKFSTIPIPGNEITLNGSDLLAQAKEEQTMLRDELKAVFDELVYGKLVEGDQSMQAATEGILNKVPSGIYVG